MEFARGYIASGIFRGHRVPQHIQNIVIRQYCVKNNLQYVLSRAEYSENMNKYCQLWAALREGYRNIVAYSVWQMPFNQKLRNSIFEFALDHNIRIHFACEELSVNNMYAVDDIHSLMCLQKAIDQRGDSQEYLHFLQIWAKNG